MINLKKLSLVLIPLALASFNLDAGRQRASVAEMELTKFTAKDIEKELEFGQLMAAQLLADYKLVKNEALLKYVNKVGQVVLQNSSRQELNYHFGIVKSKQINAYATPGGYIFITTATLKNIRSEAELAGVIGHEIAHVVERHIVKTLKIKSDEESATSIMGQLVSSSSSSAVAIFNQALDQAFDILFSAGLKKEDEYGADSLGILLTSMAGYDPNEYLNFLKRIKPLIESKKQQVSKTHPSINDRVSHLEDTFSEEGIFQMGGNININRFNESNI